MYILYNQLPLHVCALWKKNKYSFFLSFFLSKNSEAKTEAFRRFFRNFRDLQKPPQPNLQVISVF